MSTAIVYGTLADDADSAWPGRNQLMRALAAHVPVVLLERAPSTKALLDTRRPRVDRLGPNLYVVRNALALRSHRLGRRVGRVAAFIDGRWFRRALADADFDDFVFWLTEADEALAHGIPAKRLVYDCMDPNFLPDTTVQFDRVERRLARRASVVFATAATLFERMKAFNPDTILLPNAAPAAMPPVIDRERDRAVRPIVGYLGTIDWRFDAEAVLHTARALPNIDFVIAGRVNSDQEERVRPLRELPNVRFTGQLDEPTGEALVASFDVGLIPFVPSPQNDAINPVKMYMYLAYGMPVVSTWVAECRMNPFVSAAHDDVEFAQLVALAAQERDPAAFEARRAFARSNTWANRALEAVDALTSYGLLRHEPEARMP